MFFFVRAPLTVVVPTTEELHDGTAIPIQQQQQAWSSRRCIDWLVVQ